MRFLITGGAGFIGSHIVKRLLEKGHCVRVLDNFSSGKLENIDFAVRLRKARFELLRGDIRNKDICMKACRGIDFVLHQAALRSVPKSMQDPYTYNDVNINGTLFLLQASVRQRIKRFVFASSSSVYGDACVFPQKEGVLPRLISPYALTKLAGEYYCRIFSEHYKLETVCLRYFNVFGPRQSLDDEYAVVIPKFIHCLLHKMPPPIFGTGKQSRDFTYIDNVVAFNILAAIKPHIRHDVFNVACGRDHSVLELVAQLNKIIGTAIKPEFLPKRPGDVLRTCADISKGRRILGFKPMVTFSQGLQRTVQWFKASSRS
jgi:nucleoside-diphosphate-sugar epimerase